MPRIRVSTVIDARPEVVWSAVENVATHVDWMKDAVAIEFTTTQRSGVGTAFDCRTKVGPIRLTDKMEITEWKPDRAIGVRHVGLVAGDGHFRLQRAKNGRTRFTWTEKLHFPWWLGGPIGALIGGQLVLKRLWRQNLRNLKTLIES